MSGNDLFFASLQGVIEIVRQHVDKLDARGVEQHGGGLERPAVGPGLGKCDAGEGKGEMGHGNSCEQDAR